jgi:lysosomal Pro-X carboxypeptidase
MWCGCVYYALGPLLARSTFCHQPFTSGTAADFYYPLNEFNVKSVSDGCWESWSVRPREYWAKVRRSAPPTTNMCIICNTTCLSALATTFLQIGLGGKRIEGASNLVFSNGLMGPWHGGGILQNVSDTIVAVVIPNGGHHVDLMFANPGENCGLRGLESQCC